jgi:hypothetical protein
MSQRFKDEGRRIDDFGDSFLVVCSHCEGRATVANHIYDEGPRIILTCGECGHARIWTQRSPGVMHSRNARDYEDGQICIGAAVDWYFHLPLWLQTACCGETLWAYNADHLKYLETFVGAVLRERSPDEKSGWSNQSLTSRLPGWIKAGKNRPDILKCIERLKGLLV